MSECDDEVVWVKAHSKSQNMIYYWNAKTQESIWECDFVGKMTGPKVKILDQTNSATTPEYTSPERLKKTPQNTNHPKRTEKEKEHAIEEEDEEFREALLAYNEARNFSSNLFSGGQDVNRPAHHTSPKVLLPERKSQEKEVLEKQNLNNNQPSCSNAVLNKDDKAKKLKEFRIPKLIGPGKAQPDNWVLNVWQSPPPVLAGGSSKPIWSPIPAHLYSSTPFENKGIQANSTSSLSPCPPSFPSIPKHVENITNDWSQSDCSSIPDKAPEKPLSINANSSFKNPRLISPKKLVFKVREKNLDEKKIGICDYDSASTTGSYSSIRKRVGDSDSVYSGSSINENLGMRKRGKINGSVYSDSGSSSSSEMRKKLNTSSSLNSGFDKKLKVSSESVQSKDEKPIASVPTPTAVPSLTAVPSITAVPSLTTISLSENKRKSLPENPLDARHKLERRRSMQCETEKPSNLNQDEMEWQETCPSEFEKDSVCNGPQQSQQSTTLIEKTLIKPLVLVCDTNIWINEKSLPLLTEILEDNSLLGIPATIFIPCQVTKELDSIKSRESTATESTRKLARDAQRLIHDRQCTIQFQHRSKHREKADPSAEFEKNDDFVLNCALQERISAGDDKIVILVTDDLNLCIGARHVNLNVETSKSLKSFVRKYKESLRSNSSGLIWTQPSTSKASLIEVPMEIDDESVFSTNSTSNPGLTNNALPTSTTAFHAEQLNYDLKQFLNSVIEAANDRVYGELKKHAGNPNKNWKLVDYIINIIKRWSFITEKKLSGSVQQKLKKILELVKKYNRGKEEFTDNDFKLYCSCCQSFAEEFKTFYEDITKLFSDRLNNIMDEWEQRNAGRCGSYSSDDELQPADLALQNIYSCIASDYDKWKKSLEGMSEDDKKKQQCNLKEFFFKIDKVLRPLRNAMEDYPQSSLTVGDKCINQFLEATSTYYAEDGNILCFEMTTENILALFRENSLRKRAKEMMNKIKRVQTDVGVLIEELNSDDEDLF
ncbi:uncharacterized protein LOC128994687 [Macrosteles quadrilineatus]|uniref:uncharacterized protein LOC128994687 n=1 Tax=Macrosteles quadrilineatus TaxID=74068 RepID=UPI0023E118B2|nr:uncharacterized protein LOC128994687 [Macrosteles quadrilineatus]